MSMHSKNGIAIHASKCGCTLELHITELPTGERFERWQGSEAGCRYVGRGNQIITKPKPKLMQSDKARPSKASEIDAELPSPESMPETD
jgi:hypothetical protein